MSCYVRRADKKRCANDCRICDQTFHTASRIRHAPISLKSLQSKARKIFTAVRPKREDAAVLVAEIENKIVGFAYLQYEAMDYANLLENAVWLHDIYVDETVRGKSPENF